MTTFLILIGALAYCGFGILTAATMLPFEMERETRWTDLKTRRFWILTIQWPLILFRGIQNK